MQQLAGAHQLEAVVGKPRAKNGSMRTYEGWCHVVPSGYGLTERQPLALSG